MFGFRKAESRDGREDYNSMHYGQTTGELAAKIGVTHAAASQMIDLWDRAEEARRWRTEAEADQLLDRAWAVRTDRKNRRS